MTDEEKRDLKYRAWVDLDAAYARAEEFSDEQAMKQLDAYGHMNWTVGDEDYVCCFDACLAPNGIAYHVVIDCESGGWLDTVASGIVPLSEVVRPADDTTWRCPLRELPWTYADMCSENKVPIVVEEVEEVAKRWNQHLNDLIRAAEQDYSDAELRKAALNHRGEP